MLGGRVVEADLLGEDGLARARRAAHDGHGALRAASVEDRVEVGDAGRDARDVDYFRHESLVSASAFTRSSVDGGVAPARIAPGSATLESSAWSAGVRISAVRLPSTVRSSTSTKRIASPRARRRRRSRSGTLSSRHWIPLVGSILRDEKSENLLRSVVTATALGDRRERHLAERGLGSDPDRVERCFEETKKCVRGETRARSLEPGVHAAGMLALIEHGAAVADAKSASSICRARANEPPSFSLTPSSIPNASESAVRPCHQAVRE